MIIGYARVSTKDQSSLRQLDLLKSYGCEKIYTDKIGGIKTERPNLTKMIEQLKKGDKVVVSELSRFGRSTKDLINLMDQLKNIGADFKCLKEEFLDTNSSCGRFLFLIMAAIAEFEREIIVQRTKEGLSSAKARGRKGGRPRLPQEKIDLALKMYRSGEFTLKEISSSVGISVSSIFNHQAQPGHLRDNDSFNL